MYFKFEQKLFIDQLVIDGNKSVFLFTIIRTIMDFGCPCQKKNYLNLYQSWIFLLAVLELKLIYL